MTDDHVPEIEIIKATIEKIDHAVKIDRVKYDSVKMEHTFFLSNNNKTCAVFLSRDFLDDLNDYTGSRESKYWISLEGTLKRRLSVAMQIASMIPFSSDIFFDDNQDWEQNTGHNIEVFFSKEDYDIFQDGLKQLYHYLETQRTALSHLKLTKYPYDEDQQRIQDMLLYRNKQISEHGPCAFKDSISVTTRKHLKAAALIELMFLEKNILQGKYSGAVKKEIAAKMSRILQLISSPIFERIDVAEYLGGIRDETKSNQYNVTESDNTKKYDVVISFAGEDREHAEKLAVFLKVDGFAAFYDKYEEHDLWGKNLYEHLTEVYSKRGKYCVMFLSRHYAEKQWPTLERRAAQERAFKENREYILPIRIDDAEIPGILDTVLYQDLRDKSIEDIYTILKQKLLGEDNGTLV